jgi:hypothetical protein
VDQGLAHPLVVERLDLGVQAVEPHAHHRSLHVDVIASRDHLPVVLHRNRRVLEIAAAELLVHDVQPLAGEDPVHERRQARRAVEVVAVRAEDDLFPAIPAHELERTGADRVRAEGVALLLHELLGDDLGVSDGEDRDERRHRFLELDLDGVAVGRGEPRHLPRLAFPELAGALDAEEQIRRPRLHLGVQDARERVDDVLRGHFATMVESHALSEREGPREPIARGLPDLREGRGDRQGLVELDEAVEDLLGDRAAVDIADAGRIERRGVIAERPSIRTSFGRTSLYGFVLGDSGSIPGEQDEADEHEARGACAPLAGNLLPTPG